MGSKSLGFPSLYRRVRAREFSHFAISEVIANQKMASTKNNKVDIPKIPEWLSPHSKELWSRWVGSRIKSAGKIELLRVGLEALDRADSCREVINKEGLTVISRRGKMPHNHPLLKEELSSRRLFFKIMKSLHLDFNFQEDIMVDLNANEEIE